ncbi:MAG: peptidyl-prolyl cis-trans isomerase, partial [Lentisphaerae bacterium]|nr:peptidyl-prolyl cis-trans isomerase [Lentisphaerota bacterium]
SFYEAEKESFTTEETVHARHVLIATTEKDNETTRNEKKALAEKCRKELLEGADFQDIAKKYSDCPSKTTGGDLGAFQRGSMVPPFETAAFSQKINEIGPIVETRFGYHIVQVLSHTEPGTQSLDAVKDRIIEFLTDQKKRDVVHTYIDVLRDKATISYGSET